MFVEYTCHHCKKTNTFKVNADIKIDIYRNNKGNEFLNRDCKKCNKRNKIHINSLYSVYSTYQKLFLLFILVSLIVFLIYITIVENEFINKYFIESINLLGGILVIFFGVFFVYLFETRNRISLFNKSRI
jgi:hypothetical protein